MAAIQMGLRRGRWGEKTEHGAKTDQRPAQPKSGHPQAGVDCRLAELGSSWDNHRYAARGRSLMVFTAPPDRTLVVSRRTVLPEGGGLVVEPAAVLVEAGRIQAVWPLEAEPQSVDNLAVRAGARLLDYGDRLVTPAFINAHTHLALSALRAVALEHATPGNMVERFFYRVEASLTPEDIRAFARLGAFESLLNGVGLVWDHYYAADAVAEALVDVGLSGVVCPALQDLDGPGADRWEESLTTTESLAQQGRLQARGVYACVGPHATDTVSEALWGRALGLAQRHQLPIHAHLAQSIEEVQRAQERHGCSPTAWLARLGVLEEAPVGLWAHGLYASHQDLQTLAQGRNNLVYCPYSQLVFGFPARISAWNAAGVNWVVATDCAASNDSMNVQKELRFVEGQRSAGTAFTPAYERFLETGTLEDAQAVWSRREAFWRNGASEGNDRARTLLSRVWERPGRLHPGFRAGEIVPGALANLVVWDLDHPSMWPEHAPFRTLAMGDTTQAIHAMVIMGREIGTAGDFHRSVVHGETYRTAITEASDRLARLLDRV